LDVTEKYIRRRGFAMSPQSKKEYFEAIYIRYKEASRKGKTIILDEFCATCGYHRKHAIRALRRFKRFTRPKNKKIGRPSIYNNDTILSYSSAQ
jgi:hypothetical protein